MMKKTFLLFILLIFGLVAFFGYNRTTKKNEQKKLTFWSIQLKPIYEKEMNKIISEFEILHPDYEVIWIDIPIQEAQKRTLASILSSNPPDIINLNPDFSLALAQKNALEFFDEDKLEQFHPKLLDKLKYAGKIYALPFYETSPVTVYNKELYSKVSNKEFPKTYDELFLLAPEVKKVSNSAIFVSSLNENDTLSKILNKYGVYSLSSQEDKDKALGVYLMFDQMYKNGYLPSDILTINHREVVERYMSNQALSVVAGSNFINMIKQNAPDIYQKSQIAPQLSADSLNYDISLMNLIIPKKAKNKELAYEFALLLTGEKQQLRLAKLTNVLPANKYALNNEYFKNCSNDILDKSRCISVKQLDNLSCRDFGSENKKLINELLNKTLEEILLNKNANESFIEEKINLASLKLQILQKK